MKNSCFTYHWFNVFFSIATTLLQLVVNYIQLESAFHNCLSSLHSYAVVLQKSCQGNFGKFKDPTRVALTVLKNIVIF